MNIPTQNLSARFNPSDWNSRKPAYANGGPLKIPADAPMTFTEALLRRADEKDRGILYIQNEGQEDFQSYADLLLEARRVLGGLRKAGLKPGDRVILQIDSLRNHFTTFWACVLGGFTPVTVAVAPSYAEKNGVVNKVWNTWKLLRSPLIITSAHLEKAIRGLETFMGMPGLRVATVEPLKESEPAEEIFPAQPEGLVFFQLTSGSTGVPKCIQETHRGIIHHIHGAQQFNGYSSEDVTLNWLPVDHVVPILTSHLKDVYIGARQIHMRADLVLSEPLRWLDMMEKHRVTHSWSPNFGFKLISDRLAEVPSRKWDLSSIRFLMNAGEQVTMPVVREFLERTAHFGVRPEAMQPSFGMAEVCTCMTFQNAFSIERGAFRFKKSTLGGLLEEAAEEDPAAVTFVDLGPPVPGVEIRITDQENKFLPEGVIGRFQIRGAVVTPGYLYNDAANAEAFVGDGWFNSGDLGFILNGRLALTGREKEMIIVRGANFYCYEIEDVVNGIEGVEPTFVSSSAVADADSGSEGLAILFVPKAGLAGAGGEVRPQLVGLTREIRKKVAGSLGINPSFVIPLEKQSFLKTTSGKIQRSQMKKNFEAGEYNGIIEALKRASQTPDNPTAQGRDSLEEKILSIWKELLRVQSLSVSDNFFAMGGDSLLAARVISRVRDAFNVELPLQTLFNGGGTVEGMAGYVRNGETSKAGLPSIQRRGEAGRAPASMGQQRLWLLDQLNPGCPAYNVGVLARLTGDLNAAAMERALGRLMERHESLRARFEVSEGRVWQVFDASPISLMQVEVPGGGNEALERTANAEAARPFNLKTGPLLRAQLLKTGAGQHLQFTLHQSIVDGWSLGVLFRELAECYRAESEGKQPELPELPVRYGDYSLWQQDAFTPELIESQLEFWRGELSGEPPEIELPVDFKYTAAQSFQGETQSHRLPEDISNGLREFAREQGATVYMAIIAAYEAFLSRLSGQEEVIIGTAMAGRSKTELEGLIGFFVNTVALRASFLSNPSYSDLVVQAREKTLAAYQHQYAPFEKVVEQVQPRRSSVRTPIFQTWFGAWEMPPAQEAGAVRIEPTKIFMAGAQFELSLFAIDSREIELIWEYRTELFLPETVTRMRAQFESLLRRMLREPEVPVQNIFAAMSEDEDQDRIAEQIRLRDGLRTARRKKVQMPAAAS